MRIGLVIPTLNAGENFRDLLNAIALQELKIDRAIIMDSGSTDNTLHFAEAAGFDILPVEKGKFNHGLSRQYAVEYIKDTVDIVIFITQDIIVKDKQAFSALVQFFQDAAVGAAYGRQLPHENASAIAAQARLFNYTNQTMIKTYEDRKRLGIKTPFLSDSFAAYRIVALQACGGFPRAIVSEDMYAGARMLQSNWKIAYAAEACIHHSHDYTFLQEFRRYFDVGVFQARESWIREVFGGAEGEGSKLVIHQMKYFWNQHAKRSIPKAVIANVIRFAGYRLGLKEAFLPLWLKRLCSAQAYFFE